VPENRNSIILISDGLETCGDDPSAMAAFLQEIGIDFTIHVIGLDVDAATREQLSRLAETGHGIYHDAHSAEDLREALADIEGEALAAPDVVADVSPTPSLTPTETNTPSSSAPGVSPTRTLAPFFTATPTVTPVPTETPIPTETATPDLSGGSPEDITFEGDVSSSSDYPGFFAFEAVDGDLSTSWFSAGEAVDGDTSTYIWTASDEDYISAITIIGNGQNADPANQLNFGFDSVDVQVINADDQVVFTQNVSLAGTPDPTVAVKPNVWGYRIVLWFNGHESPDCGGFAELIVEAVR
jgi:hypothetical protein